MVRPDGAARASAGISYTGMKVRERNGKPIGLYHEERGKAIPAMQ